MAALGLSVVRVGEFAWSRLEPAAGEFAFDWLDRAIEVLAGAGLDVVLCTPTATPPKWLVDRHPDILPVDPHTGRTRGFGSRRHYDFSSGTYRRESLRITRVLAERYGGDTRIVGWQTDNEIGCHDTTLSISPAAVRAFRAWCEARYASIDALNTAWGNVFWSMEYGDFDEIDAPFGAVTETNPAHQLAYRRFASDQVVSFHNEMVAALRAHTRDQFVTHNFIPASDTHADNAALAAPLDFPSYDSYPLGRTDEILHGHLPARDFERFQRTGHPDLNALALDQTRGLRQRGFWIMEQQPGPVNWAPANPAPAPGMIRLWMYEAFAHGADCVSFFRWRQAPFAQEQMHAGLLRRDDQPSRRWSEIARTIAEIKELDLAGYDVSRAQVALLTDPESEWVTDIERQSAAYRLPTIQFEWYSALRKLGVDVDIVTAGDDLSHFALVAVPCLATPDTSFVSRAQQSGAAFLFGPRTGAKTAEFQIPETLPPGALADWLHARVTEVETVRPEHRIPLTFDGTEGAGKVWREWLEVDDATVLGDFEDGSPAVLQRDRATYLATLPDAQLLDRVLRVLCAQCGIATHALPDAVRLRRRGELTFAFNFGAEARDVVADSTQEFLLGGARIEAHDLAIWRSPADPSAATGASGGTP